MAVIPTTSVDLSTEIGQVLNDAGGSVNINQPLTYFTESAKINKWSKYKPVPLKANFAQDYDSSAPDYDADWWKGDIGVSCGLRIPFNSSAASGVPSNRIQYLGYLAYMVKQGSTSVPNYTYVLPTGGADQPFRIGDFRGYNTNAEQPFTTAIDGFDYICVDGYINRSEYNKLTLSIKRNNSVNGLGVKDLMPSSDYYFVAEVYIYDNGEMPKYLSGVAPNKHLICSSPLNNDNQSITLELEAADDNKNFDIVLGVQRVVNGTPTAGTGFICPWTSDNMPFMFSFKQYYDFILNVTPKRFALVTTSLSWVSVPNSTWINTTASSIIIELEVERKAERYYFIAQHYSGVPTDATTVMLKSLNTGGAPSLTPVIGAPCNSSGQTYGNGHVLIEPKTETVTTSTIYILFSSTFTKAGQNYSFSLQASEDKGTSWSNPVAYMNVYVNKTN